MAGLASSTSTSLTESAYARSSANGALSTSNSPSRTESISVTLGISLQNASPTVQENTSPSALPQPAVAGSSNTVPIAVGAVFGVLLLAAAALIVWLLFQARKLKRMQDEDKEQDLRGGSPLDKAVYAKAHVQDNSAEGLRQQLADVHWELAQAAAFAPATIRDESDYQRDLALLNDSIRQLSMRLSKSSGIRAADIRSGFAAVLCNQVFARFDPSLDPLTDCWLSIIYESIDRPAIANTWRAISTRNLPLANAAGSMAKVSQELSAKLGDLLRMAGDIEAIVEQAIFLQRAVLEDGKGFAIGCENAGLILTLICPIQQAM